MNERPRGRPARDSQGRPQVVQRGTEKRPWNDAYHELLTFTWARFIGLLFGGFLLFNLFFAWLYRLGGDCIGAEDPDSFLLAFSFSVQTMAAIGYGVMSPTTEYAYLVANLEGFLGLMVFAMASGLMFARFSRPTARVVFSNVAVVHERDRVPTLQFRVSNRRGNQIVDARVHVTALVDSVTSEGHRMRRLVDIPLVRAHSPMFSLTWVVMHQLVDDSPLLEHLSAEGVSSEFVGIVVNLTGLDESSVQTVYSRTFYGPDQFRWNHCFEDMLHTDDKGQVVVHFERIHDIRPVSPG